MLKAKRRNCGSVVELLLDRDLEVMAGRRLVQRQRFHAVFGLRLQVVRVDVEDAGPLAVLADGRW